MSTVKQAALVTPKEHIRLGRLQASPGQTFWVTTSSLANEKTVGVARSGKGAGYAQLLSREDFDRYFTVISG